MICVNHTVNRSHKVKTSVRVQNQKVGTTSGSAEAFPRIDSLEHFVEQERRIGFVAVRRRTLKRNTLRTYRPTDFDAVHALNAFTRVDVDVVPWAAV